MCLCPLLTITFMSPRTAAAPPCRPAVGLGPRPARAAVQQRRGRRAGTCLPAHCSGGRGGRVAARQLSGAAPAGSASGGGPCPPQVTPPHPPTPAPPHPPCICCPPVKEGGCCLLPCCMRPFVGHLFACAGLGSGCRSHPHASPSCHGRLRPPAGALALRAPIGSPACLFRHGSAPAPSCPVVTPAVLQVLQDWAAGRAGRGAAGARPLAGTVVPARSRAAPAGRGPARGARLPAEVGGPRGCPAYSQARLTSA